MFQSICLRAGYMPQSKKNFTWKRFDCCQQSECPTVRRHTGRLIPLEENPFRRIRPPSVKACTCASGSCPSHGDCAPEPPVSCISRRHSVSSLRRHFEHDELKLSLSSLNTDRPVTHEDNRDAVQAAAVYEKWLAEKEERRKHLEEERKMVEQVLLSEQRKKVEMERSNFLNWLKTKKAQEEKKRREEMSLQNKKRDEEEAEKQKRQVENELSFELWRKRKEQQVLESRLKEQIEKIRGEETRKKRLQMNARAYEEWLRSARNKPKPLPLNRGLDSLRASVSVAYVNPTPWEPNIESPKPSTC